jgi:hypothetical protein
MTQMTTEQILARLAQITGKNNERPIEEPMRGNIIGDISEDDSGDRAESTVESIVVSDAVEEQPIEDIRPVRTWPEEIKTLCGVWSGILADSGFIINNAVVMSKKEYLKHSKGKSQDEILSDPLLYVMFRSEDQSDVNFFSWLDRFPKVKNESK